MMILFQLLSINLSSYFEPLILGHYAFKGLHLPLSSSYTDANLLKLKLILCTQSITFDQSECAED